MKISAASKYLQAHLDGTLPWGLVLVLNLVAARLVLVPVEHYWLGLLALLMLVLWQVLGGARHITFLLQKPEGLVPAVLIAVAMVWITISTGIAVANFQASRWPPIEPPLLSLKISADGTEVFIDGPLNFPKDTALKSALAANPNLQRLVLNSQGGSVFAARALARRVQEHGLETYVRDICYSSCTLVFMAADRRVVDLKGRLGFHGYRMEGMSEDQAARASDDTQRARIFLIARGLDSGFVDRVLMTPNSELWIPSRLELIEAGVLAR